MNGTYLTVAGRIRDELEEIERIVARTRHIWETGSRNGDDYYVDAVALNLHGFYAGLERIFAIIAERIDESTPEGGDWHTELLDQMNTRIRSVRPEVLSDETVRVLDRYRGFRHVVRNVYTTEFDSEQIAPLVEGLEEAFRSTRGDLLSLAEFLEEQGR